MFPLNMFNFRVDPPKAIEIVEHTCYITGKLAWANIVWANIARHVTPKATGELAG
jgi:hypothetical protein